MTSLRAHGDNGQIGRPRRGVNSSHRAEHQLAEVSEHLDKVRDYLRL